MPNTTVSGIAASSGTPERYVAPTTGVLDTSFMIVTYALMVPLTPVPVVVALRNNAEFSDQNPSFVTPPKYPPGQTVSVPAYAAPPASGGINNPPNGEVAKATGASSGIPGAWIPSGVTAPYNLLAAPPATNPATNWPATNYIVCRDASEIYWNGTKWLAGRHP